MGAMSAMNTSVKKAKAQPPAAPLLPEVMTVEEAAAFLRLPVNLLLRKVREGRVPGAKIGRSWRFSRRLLLEWLENASIPEELVEEGMVQAVNERMAEEDEWLSVAEVRQRLGL
jgi:excisionase family DNA binding protein